MATRVNQKIEARRGETCRVRIYVTDANDDPINCDGCDALLAVAKTRDSEAKDLELDQDDDQFSLVDGDGTKDVLQWELTAEDTAAVPREKSHWDCRVTLSDRTKVVSEGPFIVLGSPTYVAAE